MEKKNKNFNMKIPHEIPFIKYFVAKKKNKFF